MQRTEEIKTLREGAASIVKQTGYFLLSVEEFRQLLNQSLTSSVLKDNRTGEQIIEFGMYKDLVREQARCLISAIQKERVANAVFCYPIVTPEQLP